MTGVMDQQLISYSWMLLFSIRERDTVKCYLETGVSKEVEWISDAEDMVHLLIWIQKQHIFSYGYFKITVRKMQIEWMKGQFFFFYQQTLSLVILHSSSEDLNVEMLSKDSEGSLVNEAHSSLSLTFIIL